MTPLAFVSAVCPHCDRFTGAPVDRSLLTGPEPIRFLCTNCSEMITVETPIKRQEAP